MNNLKKSETWKIQLTIANNLISFKDIDEELVMNSKSDNMEVMIYDKVDKVIKELSKSVLKEYQIMLEMSMKGSVFIFDCVNIVYYKHHKNI